MAEQCDLTIPEGAVAGTTLYRPVALLLDWENARITVSLVGEGGHRKKVVYDGVLTLLKALNTANLSTKSLHKRLLEKLVADGYLVGTISGTPD